eukprot:evm.model.scf_2381.2 EVM.evm.TU.scf_2381.2   scf_2381:10191-21993(-)
MAEPPAKRQRTGGRLTVQEIAEDRLTTLARQNWVKDGDAKGGGLEFKASVVEDIYSRELGGASGEPPGLKRIMLLEVSQYLELYLWPNFDPQSATYAHVMSIILMVNEKFREGVSAWACFHEREEGFAAFFQRVLELSDLREMRRHEQIAYLMFMISSFQSLEDAMVRSQVLRLVSLPLWHGLSDGRLKLELHAHSQLAKRWHRLAKKEAKALTAAANHVPIKERPETTFLPSLLSLFLSALESAGSLLSMAALPANPAATDNGSAAIQNGDLESHKQAEEVQKTVLLCERFVEYTIDLLSQLPTRRFVLTFLDDQAVLVKCKLSRLYEHARGNLFRQLVDLFEFYMNFNVDDHTGEPLYEHQVVSNHYKKLTQLQRLAFKCHPDTMQDLALAHCAKVQSREFLMAELSKLNEDELHTLVTREVRLASPEDPLAADPQFLKEVLVCKYEKRRLMREAINEMPLYPTERILWDENQIPSAHYTGEGCLALPKLNLQFLSFQDYLLRNFNLFRLEAAYEIQEDVLDVLERVGAHLDPDGNVRFKGWARMAIPINTFKIIEVRKPDIGESKPAGVKAEIVVDTKSLRGDIRGEYDELKQHDVMFLMAVRPPQRGQPASEGEDGVVPGPRELYGVQYIRGCEIIEVKDEEGKLMNDFTGRVKPDERAPPQGFLRTLVIDLDTAQYQLDMNEMASSGGEDVYSTFNLLMRRKPKENNFKAVLESIRDLMNEDCVMPDWLNNIFLGYGDPASASYKNMEDQLRQVDFKDTFLNAAHVVESFPFFSVEFKDSDGEASKDPEPPFRITFPDAKPSDAGDPAEQATLLVEPYTPPDPGPYPQDKPAINSVRFTPLQVEAIRSGVEHGLTMVVGPPGTGKTDTAVQILHILYHNFPGQRTLLITHSNQALNDLFQKLMERDVPARYLLRLGMGEQDLDTDLDFSRVGRVNAMLARRLELLAQVERMAKQFGVPEDMAYTCETAGHFWLLHVFSRWEKFVSLCSAAKTPQSVKEHFPFKEYFADAGDMFKGASYEVDMEKARGCFRHLKTMFQELEECRAFELLKGQADRVNYLMTKQAKIVAMTCTHAALKRREFLAVGLKFDNLLMEESAQILEVETCLPMLLQKPEDGLSRLKRVVLIGDHHQLPPVVKNMAFQKYSHLDQSLFTRFVRLGVPYIELDAQGRARPSLAKLYNWRYRCLGDLPAVKEGEIFKMANPGLAYEYQFVDVPDYQNIGETEPTPYFYQNLGEAEYTVRLYQFLRLIGYPARKISILTTYNGQKHLLRDVVDRRCAGHPAFGRPYKVTTVDKYQGQQNDFILLSLVRTKAFGHLRDVRRLVVATSRSRLGLYIFGRASLFSNCYELQPAFKQLMARPTALGLVKGESYGVCSRRLGDPVAVDVMSGVDQMGALVDEMSWEWQTRQSQAVHAAQMQIQSERREGEGGES